MQLFDVSGTLAVGQGASTFTFSYPTSIIVRPGGTFQDLTTSKSLTLAPGSAVNAINGSTSPTGSAVSIGSNSGGKRQTITQIQITTITITIVVVNVISYFPRITPYCIRNGAFSSPFAYVGGFAPDAGICGLSGCGLQIPNGVSLSTAELGGVMRIRIDKISIASGGTFQLASGGSGFKILNAIQFDVLGTFGFIGSGAIQAVGGCTLNLFSGASFVSAVAVQIVTISVSGAVIGTPLSLAAGATGPFFISVPSNGIPVTSNTGKKKS